MTPLPLTCRGQEIAFSCADGRWTHNLSRVASILGDDPTKLTYRRAETLLWCLNSGLATPEEVKRINRSLSSFQKSRWYDSGASRKYTVGQGEPFCLPLALVRERLVPEFAYQGSRRMPAPTPEMHGTALMACRSPREGSTDVGGDLIKAVNRVAEMRSALLGSLGESGGSHWSPRGMVIGHMAAYESLALVSNLGRFTAQPLIRLITDATAWPKQMLGLEALDATGGLSAFQRWLYAYLVVNAVNSAAPPGSIEDASLVADMLKAGKIGDPLERSRVLPAADRCLRWVAVLRSLPSEADMPRETVMYCLSRMLRGPLHPDSDAWPVEGLEE